MRCIGRIIIGVAVLTFIASCGLGSPEQRGDAAYRQAQKMEGNEKRLKQKMAYTMYQRAVKSHPEKINNKLRSRFIELSLIRAEMVLNEGNANSHAIPLFMEDIEKLMTTDAPVNLKQEYAKYLIQLADSFAVRQQTDKALSTIDKAMSFGNDPAIDAKKKQFIQNLAKENYETAEADYEIGKSDKDADALIRAEYYVQTTLLFDPNYPNAAKLLSELRKLNINTYSGYLKVIENIPDSVIFRKVNKYDILLALPVISRGGSWGISISMYNYSYNPLRLKAEHFFLVDKAGKRYRAAETKLEPEILDQEREAKFRLSFPRVGGDIVKIVYENGPHYSEKYFF